MFLFCLCVLLALLFIFVDRHRSMELQHSSNVYHFRFAYLNWHLMTLICIFIACIVLSLSLFCFALTFYLSTIFLFRFLLLFLYGAKIGSLTSAKANFNEFTAYFIDVCEYEWIAIKPHWPSAYIFPNHFFFFSIFPSQTFACLATFPFNIIHKNNETICFAHICTHFCDGWITLWAWLGRIHFEFNVTNFNYVQEEEREREERRERKKVSNHSNRYFSDE